MKLHKGQHITTKLTEMDSSFCIAIRSKILVPATLKEMKNCVTILIQAVKKHYFIKLL